MFLDVPMRALRAFARAVPIAASAAVLALASGPAAAQTRATIRVASVMPEQSAMSVAMVRMGEEIARRTEGRVTFRYFWAGTLLGSADSAEGIRDGRADAGVTAGIFLPAQLPLATIGTIPFMTSNVAAAGHAHAVAYGTIPAFHDEMARSGLHVLGFMPGGVNTVFSKTPVSDVAGMAGLRIRTVGLGADAMTAVGANPIAVPANEVYESLSKGLLDAGSGLPLDLGIDFSLHQVAPYIIDTKYGVYTMALYAISRRVYDELDAATRAVVDDESAKFLDSYYLPAVQAAERDRCEKAKAAGATFIVWDEAEVGIWKERLGSAVVDRWTAAVAGNGADGAAFLAQYRDVLRAAEAAHPWESAIATCVN
jgi:TRAP-type C4-dicarboxylate transport system substrate-binding protein